MTARLSRDWYFVTMLRLVSARSTCIRRAVGAIVVDEQGHILSTGYNGVVRGLDHCIDVICPGAGDLPGQSDRCEAVHAEVNALLQCQRLDLAHTLYVSCTPCFTCAKMICNTPIKRVVAVEDYADHRGARLFEKAGIVMNRVEESIDIPFQT